MNCEQAKQIDLVKYLDSLKIYPKKVSRDEYYYISPIRDKESKPSFHVDSINNIWFDHGGDICGGTIIDFGIRYHRCSISEFLKMLDDYVHSNKLPNTLQLPSTPAQRKKKEQKIFITSTGPIESSPLFSYLRLRRISKEIAQTFCCEAKYKLYEGVYYAIGFKNDEGGYELRNLKFKGSSKPKGITFIDRGFKTVEVFEGFFSFLSYLTIIKKWELLQSNFLILNSLSFFWKAQEIMESHELINLHLDRDKQGFIRTKQAQEISAKYHDASIAYYGFEDWNEFLCKQSKFPLYLPKLFFSLHWQLPYELIPP